GGVRNFLIAAIVMIAIVAADQASKAWILTRLGPHGDTDEIKIIPGLLRFIYVENSGAAFGLFQGKSPILTILAMVVIAFLIVYFRQAIARSLWLSIALGLQLGGALGNVIDRFRHGFVVDFVNVPKWWTFNVADSAITIGVIMLGLYLMTRDLGSNEETTQSGSPVSEAPHAED
ncbi:MAG TPA: signal peptidase II, partial [Nitrolancea sp.]|nr:signal peptidase II [Nitrolancea sp.]